MDEANRIIRGILRDLRSRIGPGVSTRELDEFAEGRIREAGEEARQAMTEATDQFVAEMAEFLQEERE